MGFHICPKPQDGFVHGRAEPYFSSHSSGDNILTCASGIVWSFPDAVLYYMVDCGWVPPKAFIDDVMSGDAKQYRRLQTKSVARTQAGYLDQADVDAARCAGGWDAAPVALGDFVRRLLDIAPDLKEIATYKEQEQFIETALAAAEGKTTRPPGKPPAPGRS